MKPLEEIISVSEARSQFNKLIERVAAGQGPISVSQNSRVEVTLINRDQLRRYLEVIWDLQRQLERLSIQSDDKAMKAIQEGEKDLRSGRWVSHQELFS
ncbi:type II toxin-antitoxin system Phd/YefM family antitoxin [Acidobacteria bacterium AH-259-L09]|nr:type II toxin-antitoxin system Phd/YefM family antitoxin [Acidobacteria bacterium AH-259-L09]